jgi:hypothetical protein
VKLSTHHELLPRSRKHGSIHHSPIGLRGVVLNQLTTGTTLLSVQDIWVVRNTDTSDSRWLDAAAGVKKRNVQIFGGNPFENFCIICLRRKSKIA